MNSLTDLRDVVDVVIGVDTHVHTHSAAVVDAATGGVLDEITVEATAQGYAELVEFANSHPMLRAWAIEGTGGHGAGLSRHLVEFSEIVIALHYREPDASGTMRGGAMYTLKKGLGMPWLGTIFALLTALAAFGIGNMVQANSVAESLRASFAVAPAVAGGGLVVVTGIVILGGICLF